MATPEKVLISTVTASSDTTIDILGLDSTYEEYELHIIDMIPASDGNYFGVQITIDGGSSWEAAATDYRRLHVANNTTVENTLAAAMQYSNSAIGDRLGNATGEGYNCIMSIYCVSSTTERKNSTFSAAYIDEGAALSVTSGCDAYTGTSAVNGIRITPITGITSGEFKLYGVN